MNKLTWTEAAAYFQDQLKRWLPIVLGSLLTMSAIRFFAHVYYGQLSDFLNIPADVLKAYWMGFRFDLSALAYLWVPAYVMQLGASLSRRPFWVKVICKFNFYYLWWGLVLLLICLVCDTGYYSYFQDHLNVLLFGLFEDDTVALLKTFWKNYALVKFAVSFMVLGSLLFMSLKKHLLAVPNLQSPPRSGVFNFSVFFLPTLALVLAARGSFGLFPLSVQDTVVSQKSFLNHLTYNGFHALVRAVKLKAQQHSRWNANLLFFGYKDPKEAFADYFDHPPTQVPKDPIELLQSTTPVNTWAKIHRPHVLVIVMESFGSAYLKFDSPQFQVLGELKKHFNEDFLTLHFLPGHGSTIGSLSSLMVAAPQRPDSGFLTESEFLQVPFRSSPARVFHAAGYQSRFIYGGNPGWRDINKFARYQGFDSVEGEVDIESRLGPLAERHDWGVFDEDVFNYIEKSLNNAEVPQFILAMTTTNHPPYQVPQTYHVAPLTPPPDLADNLINDRQLVNSRFQAYQYSNQKLGEFLTRLKRSALANKLIVAATGDHSFWMVNFSDQELMQKWGVPFYLYLPKAIRPLVFPKTVFGSHVDIFPTIYPLALSQQEVMTFGHNLLDPAWGAESQAIFSGQLAVNRSGGILAQKGRQKYSAFRWSPGFTNLEAGSPSPELDRLAKKYKALMSLTDYYFMIEKKRSTAREP